jgi:hypothetical protein
MRSCRMYQLTSLHACELSGLADGQPTSAAPHTDTRTYAEGVSTGGRLCAVASQAGSLCMTCTPTQPALGARLDSPEELAACCAPRTQTRDRARVRKNRRGAHSGFYLIICLFPGKRTLPLRRKASNRLTMFSWRSCRSIFNSRRVVRRISSLSVGRKRGCERGDSRWERVSKNTRGPPTISFLELFDSNQAPRLLRPHCELQPQTEQQNSDLYAAMWLREPMRVG